MIKNYLSNKLWLIGIKRNFSRMGFLQSLKYQRYLYKCQSASSKKIRGLTSAVTSKFESDAYCGLNSSRSSFLAKSILKKLRSEESSNKEIWDENGRYINDIYQHFPEIHNYFEDFLSKHIKIIFQSEFKIFYGFMTRSIGKGLKPSGSMLWHSDSGPGTCLNVMFCITPTNQFNGAMEFLDWKSSLEIFKSERNFLKKKEKFITNKTEKRELLTSYYKNYINKMFKNRIERITGDSGNTIIFRNNSLHRGGFAEIGHERIVCIFHLYPSKEKIDFEKYKLKGISKGDPYPIDPDF